MTVDSIRTGADLNAYLKRQDAEIAMLRGAFKAGFERPLKGPPSMVNVEAFGRYVKQQGRSFVGKADLGTPLEEQGGTGTYLVPVEYSRELMRIAEESSELIPLVRKIPMKARTKYAATKATGVSFTYVTSSDTTDITESAPTFGQLTLTAWTFALWMGISEQLLEDEDVNVGTAFAELISEAFTAKLEAELLTDTGSPATGLLANGSTNVVTMPAGSSSFGDVDFKDIVNLVGGLTTKAKRRGARFLLHPSIADIVFSIKNAQGDPIFRDSPASGRPPTILGYPFTLVDGMPDSGDSAVSTKFLAFGNPAHMVWGSRVDLEFKAFDATQYRAVNCEILYRARFRANFQVAFPEAFSVLRTAAA